MSETFTLAEGDAAIVFRAGGETSLFVPTMAPEAHVGETHILALIAAAVTGNERFQDLAEEAWNRIQADMEGSHGL